MAREGGRLQAASVCHHLLQEGSLPGGEVLDAGLRAFSEIFESSRRGGARQGDPPQPSAWSGGMGDTLPGGSPSFQPEVE